MKNPFIHRFETPKNKYIYDGITNRVIRVSNAIYNIVEDFDDYTLEEIIDKYKLFYSHEEVQNAYNSIATAKSDGLFSYNGPTQIIRTIDELSFHRATESGWNQITLAVTDQCNLRCKYCALSINGPQSNEKLSSMSLNTAKRALDHLFAHSMLSEDIIIAFYGGEPLLNFDLIKACTNYVKDTGTSKDITFHVTTNGTLMNDDIMDFFIQNDFILCISLDGPRHIHDTNRRTINDKGTYDIIIRNMQKLYEKEHRYYCARVSINMVIAPPYDFAALNEFVFSSDLIKDNTWLTTIQVSVPDSYFNRFTPVELEQKGYDELKALYRNIGIQGILNETSRRKEYQFIRSLFDIDFIKLNKSLPKGTIETKSLPQVPIKRQITGGAMCFPGIQKMYIGTGGKFFPCERVLREDCFCIGDVYEGINHTKVIRLLDEFGNLTSEDCLNCWSMNLCGMCIERSQDNHGLNASIKRQGCKAQRSSIHELIVECCSILEENPTAFDFARNWE